MLVMMCVLCVLYGISPNNSEFTSHGTGLVNVVNFVETRNQDLLQLPFV